MQINYLILFSFLLLNGILAEKDSTLYKKSNNSLNSSKSPSKRSSYYHQNGLLSADAYNYGYQIPYASAAAYHRPLSLGSPYASGLGLSHLHLHAGASPAHFAAHSPHHLHAGASPVHLHAGASPVHFAAHSHIPTLAPTAIVPAPTQYTIRPGAAVVQSYQVNYPQYYHHKAPVHVPAQVIPQHFHYQTPIISAGFPSAAPITPIAPIAPAPSPLPINPFNFFVPNRPGVQLAPLPDQRPIFVSFQSPTAATPIHPTFLAPTATTIPTSVIQVAGTGLASGQIPSQVIPTSAPSQTPWRPIFVNQPAPTNPPTPSANRPAISLLPPYQPPVEDYDYDGQQQYFSNNNEASDNNYFSSTDGYHY